MLNIITKTIAKYNLIQENDVVAVGVSGGPDSVALLHVLSNLKECLGIRLMAVHVNHTLRGDESDGDLRYVADLCKRLGVELCTKSVDTKVFAKQKKLSIELAARELRYGFYDEVAAAYGVDKIALAHNMNDRSETVLMNIIRGTGLDGLKGIDYIRDRYIRPFLNVDRNRIEKYCEENGLFPRIDSSNLNNIYTRNKIRLDVIPYINKLFDVNIANSVCRMSEIIKDDLDFLKEQSDNIFKKCKIEVKNGILTINMTELKKYHIAIIKRVLRRAISEVKGNVVSIENVHIESIIKLIFEGKTGKIVELPANLRVKRLRGQLSIFILSPMSS